MGLLLLLLAAVAGDPPQFTISTLDGRSVAGSVSALTDQQLTVLQKGTPTTFQLAEIRSLTAAESASGKPRDLAMEAAKKAPIWLETVDGSHFPAATYEVSRGVARLGLLSGEAISVPVKAIKVVQFRAADRASAGWLADVKSDVTADLIVVRKGDGTDFVEGSAGDVNEEIVHFSVDNDSVPVKRPKVAGIVYFHPDNAEALPAAACVVDDLGGARLQAKSVSLAGDRLEIVSTFGAKFTWPADTLRWLDFSTSRMSYLSDLPADTTEFTPFLDFGKQAPSLAAYYQPRRDRCLDNGPLRVNHVTYAKGLSIPTRTTLSFRISGKGQRFKALAGIDDSVGGAGSVQLEITGDGKSLYRGKITGRDKPAELDLNVAGVKRLNILVDFGEGLDVGNYLDLCDARIVK